MVGNLQIEITSDGSDTVFNKDLNEHYHSTFGALQESMVVFINAGFKVCEKQELSIFEMGFGTGLNAFLTYLEARKTSKKVRYHSIEKYPLNPEITKHLNYQKFFNPNDFEVFHQMVDSQWDNGIVISENFYFKKIHSDLITYEFERSYDLIYFDAFAPEKQPELWTADIFKKIFDHSLGEAVLTTYSAKGDVKRALKSAGYTVERLPGPPGKRHILRARRIL